MAPADRGLVENALSPDWVKEIWTGSYDKVLPVTIAGFEISAILPAVLYMFRFGHRRGTGNFLATYGPASGTPAQKRRRTTAERIASNLAETNELTGFDGDVEKAILGDLMLCFCLENVRHRLGRDQPVQRVAPTHYLASWIDLPWNLSNLRYVPEMIVAMLANRRTGDYVVPSDETDRTRFTVLNRYEDNPLFRAFGQGVTRRSGSSSDLASDCFNETHDALGLDQLLTIRLAQQLRTAPQKVRPSKTQGADAHKISNQRPIAEAAGRRFSDDIRRFVRSYANSAPRHAFVDLLESCITVGLTTILTSTVEVLFRWEATGRVTDVDAQRPAELFVDCSSGADRRLRLRAEQSIDDLLRRLERIPVILMALRLLDYEARSRPRIRLQQVAARPYATEWLNLLGDLFHERHPEAPHVALLIEDKAEKLADKMTDDHEDVASMLRSALDDGPHPASRLARGLITLMGRQPRIDLTNMVDSCFAVERPNGLAVKRTTTRGSGPGTRRRRDVRALVFTDSVLEYLVHLHLLPGPNGGSDANIVSFLNFLRECYGFHVDTAPPGMTVSNEVLGRNRAALERRLRDLGLLIGVNDAERMKRLTARFETTGGM